MDQFSSCDAIHGFPLGEKILVRGGSYGSILVGAYAMWGQSGWLAVGYAVFSVVAYMGLMRYSVCARCPHVFVAGDCLFLPAPLVKSFVVPREGRLKWWEGLVAVGAVVGTVVIPLPWLFASPVLLVVFGLLTLTYLIALGGHICKKCQVEICPLNRNPSCR